MRSTRDDTLYKTAVTQMFDAQLAHLQWMQNEYGARMGEIPMAPQHQKFMAERLTMLVRQGLVDITVLTDLLYKLDCLRTTATADCIQELR